MGIPDGQGGYKAPTRFVGEKLCERVGGEPVGGFEGFHRVPSRGCYTNLY